jgi:hypothetical protein
MSQTMTAAAQIAGGPDAGEKSQLSDVAKGVVDQIAAMRNALKGNLLRQKADVKRQVAMRRAQAMANMQAQAPAGPAAQPQAAMPAGQAAQAGGPGQGPDGATNGVPNQIVAILKHLIEQEVTRQISLFAAQVGLPFAPQGTPDLLGEYFAPVVRKAIEDEAQRQIGPLIARQIVVGPDGKAGGSPDQV